MRLPAQDRREQLLTVAMKLFAERGFDGTSTREIAEAAGINEALIFRHFASKEELYSAVVADVVASSSSRRNLREWLSSDLDDRSVITGVAARLLDRTSDDAALTRLMLFSALRRHECSNQVFRSYIADVYRLLEDFIRARVESGRFRAVDPTVAARAFLGAIVYQFLDAELFAATGTHEIDTESVAEEIAEMWLEGVSATPVSRRKASRESHAQKMQNEAVV
jgi:AcrR family transcriptional regulator